MLSHFDASDVWLAFNPGDFLAELELSPAMFAIGQAGRLPPALLRSVQGEWLGISDCLCGYGGSGPHNTVELLAALGLDRETVAPIVFSSRFVHLDVGRGELVKRASDPLTHLPADAYVTDDTVIVPLQDRSSGASRSWLRWEPRAGDHTFERERNGEGNTLKDWCEELLCRDPPPWATPPPRARIYTSRDTAQQAGLERQGESFTLIVEQGDLQLWCAAGSLGAGKLPHEVITEALAIVGLKEPRLTRRLRQPAYVEVGGPLRCEPSELAVALRGDG